MKTRITNRELKERINLYILLGGRIVGVLMILISIAFPITKIQAMGFTFYANHLFIGGVLVLLIPLIKKIIPLIFKKK